MPIRPPRARPLRTAIAAGAVGLTAALVVAAPAHATRRTVEDARGDVLKQAGTKDPVVAANNASADLVRFVADLRPSELVLTTTVRALPKNYWAMLWRLQTDTGVDYTVGLLKTGTVSFELNQAGAAVVCDGLIKKVEPRASRVSVTVPLTCLGSPATIRAGAGTATTSSDFGRIYTDDALRTAKFTQDALRLGRPVKQG